MRRIKRAGFTKLTSRLKEELRRARTRLLDTRRSSFAMDYQEQRLVLPIRSPAGIFEFSSIYEKILLNAADEYLQHRFRILGSDLLCVNKTDGSVFEHNKPTADEARRLLGLISSDYSLINWSADFKSGYQWLENTHYTLVKYGDGILPSKRIPIGNLKPLSFDYDGSGVDIKVPWELSRMQHLPQLALAYGMTKNKIESEKYVREFQNIILDFISSNPPRYGVNWVCSMEVGIRAANLLTAYHLFSYFGAVFSSEFDRILCRSVYEHGLHILTNLEYSPDFRGNHYLADIIGLLFCGAYLPSLPATDCMMAFAVQEFISEIESQFLEDGLNFEASTSYHRLTTEIALYGASLILGLATEKKEALVSYDYTLHEVTPALKPGPMRFYELNTGEAGPLSPNWLQRLQKIGEATASLLNEKGRAPQIGDNDGGRFLQFTPEWQQECLKTKTQPAGVDVGASNLINCAHEFLNFSYLLHGFAAFFGSESSFDSFDNASSKFAAEYHLLETPEYRMVRFFMGAPNNLPAVIPGSVTRAHPPKFRAMPNFGLWIYKTGRLTINVRLGLVGQGGRGGHAHNDQLSVEVYISGTPIIVDSGTYCYTSDAKQRNYFRSTSAHNTLCVAGLEQNEWGPGVQGLFRLTDRAKPVVEQAIPGAFSGKHYGFDAEVCRSLIMENESVSAVDRFDKSFRGSSRFITFHLYPGLTPTISDNKAKITVGELQIQLTADSAWILEDSEYSPTYGIKTPAKVLKLYVVPDEVNWKLRIL